MEELFVWNLDEEYRSINQYLNEHIKDVLRKEGKVNYCFLPRIRDTGFPSGRIFNMKVSIGLSVLLNRNFSGVGKYTFYLSKYLIKHSYNIEEIEIEGLIFFKRIHIKSFLEQVNNKKGTDKINEYLLKTVKTNRTFRKFLSAVLETASKFVQTDIYLEPNFVPLSYNAKKTISFVHDLSFFNPNFHPFYRIERVSYGFIQKTSKSDIILVPSNFIKYEISDKFPWLEHKIKVIYHGIDHTIFKPNGSNNTEKRYILFVGNIEPRKNLTNLLKAYSLLPADYRNSYPLVIISRNGWRNEEVFRFISENKLWNNIIIRNDIYSDEELANLYRNALFLIYPSIYEGFGFPPLEAMSCGCPVIVSNKASLPEICGKNALYVDPFNVDDIFDKLIYAIENPNVLENLAKRALNHVKRFSWDRAAKEHLKLFLKLF